MTSPDSPIFCRMAENEEDRGRAASFMYRIAHLRHGCAPPPLPSIVFFAEADGEIAGTIALELGEPGKALPLEEIYEFDRALTPWPWKRGEVAQIGRWTAIRKGVAIPLMLSAVVHAIGRGRNYCLAEMKEPIRAHAAAIGMNLREVTGHKLLLRKIPPAGLAYYIEPPAPCLYMLCLRQMEEALKRRL